jgi:predicted Fe-Mo cluster-binding NifX family protein
MKKIALPVTEASHVDGHFGHCEFYNIYSISATNEIIESETLQSPQGCGCKSNIAGVLAEKGVTVMLAGGIGNGAINVLNSHGIEVVRGCEGQADEAVRKFLAGQISDNGISCSHHDSDHSHDHDHQCNH